MTDEAHSSRFGVLRHCGLVAIPVIFFLFSIVSRDDFGSAWDEHYSYLRGQGTVAYLRECLATGTLGGNEAMAQLDKAQFHPTFFATANYVCDALCRRYCGMTHVAAHHMLPAAVAAMGLLFLGLLMGLLFDELTGFLAQLFMVFYVPFIAQAQFNDKDVPGMVGAVAGLYFLCRLRRGGLCRDAVLSGLSLGLGITSNLNSLLVLPVIAVGALLECRRANSLAGATAFTWRRSSALGLTVLATLLLTIYATWPWLWRDPGLLFRSISHFKGDFFNGRILYFGRLYHGNRLPWHYTPLSLLMATPLVTLLGMAGGAVVALVALRKKTFTTGHGLVFALLLIPVLSRMVPGVIRYHGMRHVFLAVPGVAGVAAIGLAAFLRHRPSLQTPVRRALVVTALAGVLLRQAAQVHPHEVCYYNELVRLAIPQHLERWFEMDAYEVSYKDGMDWINAHAATGDTIFVPLLYKTGHPSQPFPGPREGLTMGLDGAAYTLFSVYDPMRYPRVIGAHFPGNFNTNPVYVVRRYDSDILYVFEKKKPSPDPQAP